MFSNVGVDGFVRPDDQFFPQSRKLAGPSQPARLLAPYASQSGAFRGRRHSEEDCPMRSPFARDRDRIVHSNAFRRLNSKTQVFLSGEGDHYRTRLTHSLEVAQIARALSRVLNLDEDLAEAISLAHDIGHTPFGHAGERALDRALNGFGGFEHNVQTIRLLTELEGRYAAFKGLNLSWEVLEGLVKHNGPLHNVVKNSSVDGALARSTAFFAEVAEIYDFDLLLQAGPEAQIAAIADDIAYNNHDIDDGLRAGLFRLGDLCELPLITTIMEELRSEFGDVDDSRLVFELNRRLISRMVADVVEETQRRLALLAPRCSDDIRAAQGAVVAFSSAMEQEVKLLRTFLFSRVYRHERVMRIMSNAERIVEDLVRYLMNKPEALPKEWRSRRVRIDLHLCAAQIRDFVAGMTDRYALDLHRSLFDVTPKLR